MHDTTAPQPSPHSEALAEELAVLAERVTALEAASRATERVPVPALDDADQFWALNGLRTRNTEHPATESGTVMLVGSLTLPDGSPVAWQQGAATEAMIETPWVDHAVMFNALGHPVRLELLRHILSGVHSTAELAEIASLGTTGQLHHHLRQLVAARWVRQSARGSYEVPAARVVPLLVCLAGAEG
ncbi:MAG: ArsR/SmtB family transcription factor [Leucobacter sp.]